MAIPSMSAATIAAGGSIRGRWGAGTRAKIGDAAAERRFLGWLAVAGSDGIASIPCRAWQQRHRHAAMLAQHREDFVWQPAEGYCMVRAYLVNSYSDMAIHPASARCNSLLLENTMSDALDSGVIELNVEADETRIAYGQTGQDIVLDYLLRSARRTRGPGFYVDVGCAWPKLWSNTYFFYKKKWRGICIDANPAMEELFRKDRPRDTYVNCGIATQERVTPFFMFAHPKFNTFDPRRAAQFKDRADPHKKLIRTMDVPVRRLSSVLDEHLPEGQEIDLLSIDVESYEMQVLESLDLTRYQPAVIVAELVMSVENGLASPVSKFLTSHGYRLSAFTGHDAFFVLPR